MDKLNKVLLALSPEGDANGIYEADSFSINAVKDAELIFVDVPMQSGIKL